LAFGRAVVVIGALEDEANALGQETDLVSFAPDEQIQGNLTRPIVLGHPIHTRLPPILGGFQAVVAFQCLESLFLILGVLLSGLLGSLASLSGLAIGLAELHVGEANRIIQVQMGGEVPTAVVGIMTANIVGVQR